MSDYLDSVFLEEWAEKKQLALDCLEDIKDMMQIDGVAKLSRSIQKDLKVLEKMTPRDLKNVRCSNINRFYALIRCLKQQSDVKAVLKPYSFLEDSNLKGRCLSVDIVCQPLICGETWIKVIARNRQAITSTSKGDCVFGKSSILDQAHFFVEASLQNKYNYQVPKIIFHFDSGVDDCVAIALLELGIEVTGNVEHIECKNTFESDHTYAKELARPKATEARELKIPLLKEEAEMKLNLDVCALLAYVSQLTNGGSDLLCESKVLNLQAKAEQETPLCPILDELFEGKQLLCCKSALETFENILNTLGGPNEKKRAAALINRLNIVSDTIRPIFLKTNKRITNRSAIIFMTGEDHQAITVSANNGIAKAAASQGHKFAVFIHQARSLTEMKGLNLKKNPSEPMEPME